MFVFSCELFRSTRTFRGWLSIKITIFFYLYKFLFNVISIIFSSSFPIESHFDVGRKRKMKKNLRKKRKHLKKVNFSPLLFHNHFHIIIIGGGSGINSIIIIIILNIIGIIIIIACSLKNITIKITIFIVAITEEFIIIGMCWKIVGINERWNIRVCVGFIVVAIKISTLCEMRKKIKRKKKTRWKVYERLIRKSNYFSLRDANKLQQHHQ